jgi:hypothetical protein
MARMLWPENCIFYISSLYEFSHSLGQVRLSRHTESQCHPGSAAPPIAAILPLWGCSSVDLFNQLISSYEERQRYG